jgi:mono/diheme cytochrome c family protein
MGKIIGFAVVLALLGAGTGWAETTGKQDYADYCARCHGDDGRGNGPAVKIIPGYKPSDLTNLIPTHGGQFPRDEVFQVIDGRKRVPGHNDWDTDMPLWGLQFQPEGKEFSAESEKKVHQRISNLVDYIQSLQRK